jgi:oligoribonuclease
MKTLQSRDNLVWIDLEMTGLDPDKEKIIEIATLITDSSLNIIAEGPNLIISQPKEILNSMDEWNQNQHRPASNCRRELGRIRRKRPKGESITKSRR